MPILGRSAPKSIGAPGLLTSGCGDCFVRAAPYAAVPVEYVRLDDGYREWRPSAPLRRFVECYWRRPANPEARIQLVTPDGCVDVVLSCSGNAPDSLAVVGLMTQPRTVRIGRGQEYFGVRFRPAMAAAFLPEAAHITDQIVPLAEFWGSAAHSLAGRLAACPTFEEKSGVMDAILRPARRSEMGLRAIEQLAAGPRSLDVLAAENSVSTRQLRRVCVERAGVPPKFLIRILRFRKAIERIRAMRGTRPDWARFALESGYFDQAHLIRECKEFSGFTPGRYLQYGSRPGT